MTLGNYNHVKAAFLLHKNSYSFLLALTRDDIEITALHVLGLYTV